ncbi:MAG: BrxA family protein [Candidatus Paceibacterota bacterium]
MEYDTLPSAVGSHLKLDEVFEVLELYRKHGPETVKERVLRDNIFDYNTTNARNRVLTSVRRSFLSFNSKVRKRSFLETISALDEKAKREVLFYRLCRRSYTSYRITLKVFVPAYNDGIEFLKKEKVIEFLKRKKETTKSVEKWTESTINTVGSKYLTTMKKFGYLSGRQKKKINYFSPELESVTYAIYELLDRDKTPKKIINSDRLKLFMLQKRDILNYLERIGSTGYIKFGRAGDLYEIHPMARFEELHNAIK